MTLLSGRGLLDPRRGPDHAGPPCSNDPARRGLFFKINFLSLCGLIAGSMTNPPALAYASSLAPKSDETTMSFVTVYPLTMLLRLFVAQALVLFFADQARERRLSDIM